MATNFELERQRYILSNTPFEVKYRLELALRNLDYSRLDLMFSEFDSIIDRIREAKRATIYIKNISLMPNKPY